MSLKRKTGEKFICLEITIENLSNGSNHSSTAQYFILTICYRILFMTQGRRKLMIFLGKKGFNRSLLHYSYLPSFP